MAEEMTKPLIDAVAYARFSSNHQRDESIDAQLRDIRSFAKSNGIRIIAEYADKAFSLSSTAIWRLMALDGIITFLPASFW